MKRVFFSVCFLTSIFCYSQKTSGDGVIDDGLLTKDLPDGVNREIIMKYIQDFNSGLVAAKNKNFNSVDDAIAYLGVDPRGATLEQLEAQLSDQCKSCVVSKSLVQKINEIKSHIGLEYTDMIAIRKALKNLTVAFSLSNAEFGYLAMIDLSLQSIANSFDLNNQQGRLPHWLACIFGVVGSTIGGTLAGGGTGATIGVAVGAAPGAVAGALIGGIVGAFGGAFVGAAAFC